ncbi:MAG: hypothetical protein V4696_10320 [Pseudomonadota bacterium]
MTQDKPHSGEMLHFVFDGPPGPEAGRFIECETPDGRSVRAGEWHKREDGYWELRVPIASMPKHSGDTTTVERVAQSDRDAAETYLRESQPDAGWDNEGREARIEMERVAIGEADGHPLVQLLARHRLAALATDNADETTQRDEQGEAMICEGCGSTKTIAAILRDHGPQSIACCPERKMVEARHFWQRAVRADNADEPSEVWAFCCNGKAQDCSCVVRHHGYRDNADEPSEADVVRFLEQGFRNIDLPHLSKADLRDIAGAFSAMQAARGQSTEDYCGINQVDDEGQS